MRHIPPLLLFVAVLCGMVPAVAAPPDYRATPCAGDFTGVPNSVLCGMLVVDETRGSNNGRRVTIPVAVVKAIHPREGAVPVVVLHGGPGGDSLGDLPKQLRSADSQEAVAQDQDWIYFDQRGSGLSTPLLDCGTRLLLNDAGPLSDAAAGALIACGARHAGAGVDLAAYNAIEVARDLHDLLQALKLEQVDLFGASYGTRIAFTFLRLQPRSVRAVVLNSVWSPESKWAEGGPKMIADAVHLLFARCAADRTCRRAFPDPERDLRGVANRLLAGPVKSGDKTFTADDLGGFLMDTLYDHTGARSLPRDVHAFARGDFSALEEQKNPASTYVDLQHLTHLCKEEFPFERREHVADGIANDPVGQVSVKSFQRYFDVCASLSVGAPDPAEGEPMASNVAALFLAAEFDPGCPPALARIAADRFERAQFVQIPNTTHGVFRISACARQMVRDFLRDPGKPVDRSCTMGPPKRFGFVVRD